MEARELLGLMGKAGLYAPIGDRDLRGACLTRETIASASPLADAVWALQGLGITPLLIAGTDAQQVQWAGPALQGALMGGFAITEPESGSDVASVKTSAKRDGDTWVINGHKWFTSSADGAAFAIVMAVTEPDCENPYARASQILVPTICVVGEQDGATPPALVKATADLIPGAGFEVIANAGHIPCAEQPAAVSKIIRQLMAQI